MRLSNCNTITGREQWVWIATKKSRSSLAPSVKVKVQCNFAQSSKFKEFKTVRLEFTWAWKFRLSAHAPWLYYSWTIADFTWGGVTWNLGSVPRPVKFWHSAPVWRGHFPRGRGTGRESRGHLSRIFKIGSQYYTIVLDMAKWWKEYTLEQC